MERAKGLKKEAAEEAKPAEVKAEKPARKLKVA